MHDLAVLELEDCRRCGLWKARTRIVNGSGNPRAAVMFTGEAPGKAEDLKGIGFQGQAGKIFEALLSYLGLSRETIWLNNAIRCRPLNGRKNRTPRMGEIEACRPWLLQDMETVDPKVVVTLGRIAYESVSGRQDFTEKRGRLLNISGGPALFPLFHPAYLIYRRASRQLMCHDLMELGRYLDEIGIDRAKQTRPGDVFCES